MTILRKGTLYEQWTVFHGNLWSLLRGFLLPLSRSLRRMGLSFPRPSLCYPLPPLPPPIFSFSSFPLFLTPVVSPPLNTDLVTVVREVNGVDRVRWVPEQKDT